MKNYNWTTFTKRITIKASMSELYDAWTKAAEIETWFLSDCTNFDKKGMELDRDTNFSAGDTYAWSWYCYDITEKNKISIANGKDHIQFNFAGECPVDIKLSQDREYVTVELIQSNIPTDDESKQNIRLGCDSGWSFFMVNLKSVYEGGLDLRNKDDGLKGMLNN